MGRGKASVCHNRAFDQSLPPSKEEGNKVTPHEVPQTKAARKCRSLGWSFP